MTDRPILFSAEMIRALLAGRKTQTRRVIDTSHLEGDGYKCSGRLHEFERGLKHGLEMVCEKRGLWNASTNPNGRSGRYIPVRHRTGDRLWVREAHTIVPRTAYRMSVGTGSIEQREHPEDGYSAAVFREGFDRSSGGIRWRPSIHMPRWASRLTLVVTDVRVQRVQEIIEDDAFAEGAWRWGMDTPNGSFHQTATENFRTLWDSLNAKRGFGWDQNPWATATTFTVHKRNIDEIGDQT